MRKNTHTKIKSIDKLTKYLQTHRKNRKKIVHCHGVFDLLHPGHIKYFESAKKKGDILVVTITKDEFVNKGPGRPIFNQELRAESIAAIECVDAVCISNWPTAVEMIKIVKPNLYVKGGDYTDKKSDLTGKIYEEEEAVKSVGGMLHFTDDITFSSSSLINTYFTPYPEEAKDFFSNFKNKYSTQRIIDYLKDLQDIKVLV
ncbi:adenylyltransferase/cytidyltransferase family protein, partial [bacterium]|nr:adenylyltransferase/cytidyltransferase family protein [bacterium]